MKRLLLTVFFSLLLQLQINAQNQQAKIKYMDAEEAFAAGNYKTSLAKLDEAEKLLGSSNPKILFMRIMVQDQLIRTDTNFFRSYTNYAILSALRDNCNNYTKKYNTPELNDKNMEVYKTLQQYSAYPATKQAFDLRVKTEQEKIERAKAEQYRIMQLAEQKRQREAEALRLEEERKKQAALEAEAIINKHESLTMGWSSGAMAPYGIYLYSLHYDKVGFYAGIRSGFKSVKHSYDFNYTPTGVSSIDNKTRHTKGIALDAGLTIPISYRVSTYMALGISDHETYSKSTFYVDGVQESANYGINDDWMFGLATSVGAICRFNKGLMVTLGLSAVNFKHREWCFGVGYDFLAHHNTP
jgi:opacity protein-like surface antigen